MGRKRTISILGPKGLGEDLRRLIISWWRLYTHFLYRRRVTSGDSTSPGGDSSSPGKRASPNLSGDKLPYELAPSKVRQVASDACWRSQPLSHADVLMRMVGNGKTISPLLQAPWVTVHIFRFDWLHCADQGVAADHLGNLFAELAAQYPGANKDERYGNLYADILADYEALHIEDRMDCLKPAFCEQKDSRKLRASAAKVRALVPIAYRIAQQVLDPKDALEGAMLCASYHLSEVYDALSSRTAESQSKLKEHSVRFAAQYVALHDAENADDTRKWRIKPKLHFFLHICSDGSVPRRTWCYRDEDFGGSVARCARRRGGQLRPQATSKSVLDRFAMMNPAIRIR